MHIFSIPILILGLLAPLYSTAPLEGAVSSNIIPRQIQNPFFFGVEVCEDANFGGECEHISRLFNYCVLLGEEWSDRISSIKPDQNSICAFFKATDCSGISVQMVWPGVDNLVDNGFNDNTKSMRCWSST